jgi:predicted nucleic acid-binding protein
MGKKEIKPILCDSNFLFDFLKGEERAKRAISKIGMERVSFSIITIAEAYAGSSKVEFAMLKVLFSNHRIYPINEDVSKTFNGLIQNHYSRKKWIPDALIAATAIENNLELFTYNRKDFDFIPDLKLYNP